MTKGKSLLMTYIVIAILVAVLLTALIYIWLVLGKTKPKPKPEPSLQSTDSGNIILDLNPRRDNFPLLGTNVESWYAVQQPCIFGELLCRLNGVSLKDKQVDDGPICKQPSQECTSTSWSLVRIGNIAANSTYTQGGISYYLVYPTANRTKIGEYSDTNNDIVVDYRGMLIPTSGVDGFDKDIFTFNGKKDDIKIPTNAGSNVYTSMLDFVGRYVYSKDDPKGGLSRIKQQSDNLYAFGGIYQIASSFGIPLSYRLGSSNLTIKTSSGTPTNLGIWLGATIKLFLNGGVHVTHTELLNEPDGNWAQKLSMAQYFSIVKSVKQTFQYFGIKDVKILGPGLSRIQAMFDWMESPNLEDYLMYMKDNCPNCLDGISCHTWEDGNIPGDGPQAMINSINSTIAMRDVYAPGLPIFITELGRNINIIPNPIFYETPMTFTYSLSGKTSVNSYYPPKASDRDKYCQSPYLQTEVAGAQDLAPSNVAMTFATFLVMVSCNIDGLCFWKLADLGGCYWDGKLGEWVTWGDSFGYGMFGRDNRIKPLGSLMTLFTKSLPANPIRVTVPNGYNIINSEATNRAQDQLSLVTCNYAAIAVSDYTKDNKDINNPTNQYLSYRVKGQFFLNTVAVYIVNYTGYLKAGGFNRVYDNGRLIYQEFPPGKDSYIVTGLDANYLKIGAKLEYISSTNETVISYHLPAGCTIILSLATTVPYRSSPISYNKTACELFPEDALCSN